MTRKIVFLALLTATLLGDAGIAPCSAQRISLSVDSLFSLIDDRSRTIRLKALNADEATAGTGEARSSRLPQLSASLSVGYLGNGYLTDRDFSDGMAVHNPHSANNFALEAMQLIYSGGAVSAGIRMADLNARMARLDLEESRQQVRFLLLGWLIDLQCLHNRRRVIDENIALARQVIARMQARHDEGVALQNDITRYELQLQDLMLQREKTGEAVRTTDYKLANALGYPAGTTEFVPQLPAADGALNIKAEEGWQRDACTSGIALQKAELGISMSETSRRLVAAERRPKLSLFAYGRFDSPIVIEVPVLDKNFMYWGFGANISFNIASLYTSNHRMRRARIAERESRETYGVALENTQDGVKAAYESWRTATAELRTQEKSLELARQNYAIVNDRMAEGMALVTDMVDAANVRLAAEIGLENARTRLLFCYYRLKYTTNTL